MSPGMLERARTRLYEPRPPRPRAPGIVEPSFSAVGLVVGLWFFSISLTPSLLPREGWVQGLQSGVSFIVGYGLGAGAFAVWRFLTIPPARGRTRAVLLVASLGVIAVQSTFAVWAYVGWQNATRLEFGMAPLSALVWPVIVVGAAVAAATLLIIARSLRVLFRWADTVADKFLPRRLAVALTAVLLGGLLWWIASGAFVNAFFTTSSWISSAHDGTTDAGVVQPGARETSGSPDSLVKWNDLGRQGRNFVATGPTASDIDEVGPGGAKQPIRAYVGLRSADTAQARADLLLAELQRTGAFDRRVLVVATTTGTGLLDGDGVDPLEYLWNGDTAIAGVQYSFLPSWISLLADQAEVEDTSRVVFRTIHDYWSTLPQESRPRLYLYGLSLGAMGVEAVLSSADILNEPIDGALMSGPPFLNDMHEEITRARDEGSPSWLPIFNGGRTVRFANEQGISEANRAEWGPTRLVYLQHGTDPVVFFNGQLAWQEPSWLQGQRAPGVSEQMRWYPLVTMWQVLLDMPAAGSVPQGFGHLYTPTSNLHAWTAVTDAPMRQRELDELSAALEERSASQAGVLNH